MTRRGVSFNVISDRTDRYFWSWFQSGVWEPETFEVFDRFVTPDTVFLDIGSWIGPTAIYAAHKARRVICVEADPIAADKLRRNISLNPQVASKIEVIEKALSLSDKPVVLASLGQGGDSMSSLLFAGSGKQWTVPTIQPAELLKKAADAPVFIKMDIEGGEYLAVPFSAGAWSRPRTSILLSLHPEHIQTKVDFHRRWQMVAGLFFALRSYAISSVDKGVIRNRPILTALNRLGAPVFPSGKNWLFVRT